MKKFSIVLVLVLALAVVFCSCGKKETETPYDYDLSEYVTLGTFPNVAVDMDEAEKSLKELEEYREAGGSLIVDAQPGMYGRMAELLGEISRSSGVHIVSSTGFHKTEFCKRKYP